MQGKEYANIYSNRRLNQKETTLKRQTKHDYIQNQQYDFSYPEDTKFKYEHTGQLNHLNINTGRHNVGIDDDEIDHEMEYPRQIPHRIPFTAQSSKVPEADWAYVDDSSDRINYDQAFEEMKLGMERENYYNSNSQEEYDNVYDQYINKNINSPDTESYDHGLSHEDIGQQDYGFPDNDTSDLRNEMAEEYASNEGIAIPKATITARREDIELNIEENTSPYKLLNHQGSSTNTLGKAVTHHKSVESSESTLRSPNLLLNGNSNVKTYVLNKSRKLISNLNKSEKDCNYWSRTRAVSNQELLIQQINK